MEFSKSQNLTTVISSPLTLFLVQCPKVSSDCKSEIVSSPDLTSGTGRSTGEAKCRDGGPHGLQEGRLMMP